MSLQSVVVVDFVDPHKFSIHSIHRERREIRRFRFETIPYYYPATFDFDDWKTYPFIDFL